MERESGPLREFESLFVVNSCTRISGDDGNNSLFTLLMLSEFPELARNSFFDDFGDFGGVLGFDLFLSLFPSSLSDLSECPFSSFSSSFSFSFFACSFSSAFSFLRLLFMEDDDEESSESSCDIPRCILLSEEIGKSPDLEMEGEVVAEEDEAMIPSPFGREEDMSFLSSEGESIRVELLLPLV